MIEIMMILRFVFEIFKVALAERQKAIVARQKYDLDESAMLHIAVTAAHRIRDSALTESGQAAKIEELVENDPETKEQSPRP